MATTNEIRPESRTVPGESPFVSLSKPPAPFTLVLFGATGDLAGRKLFPALNELFQANYLAADFAILGVGRRDWTDAHFRATVQDKMGKAATDQKAAAVERFLSHVH